MSQPNEHLTQTERAVFSALVEFFRPMNNWLDSLPEIVWHLAAVALFVTTALAVACIPRNYILRGAPDAASWRDLRWWAAVALTPYALIYYFLK
jgi:hypothetical protein